MFKLFSSKIYICISYGVPDDTDSIALAENIRIGIKKGRIIIGTKILFFAMPNVNAEPKIPIDIKTGDPITNVEIIIKESFIDILKKIEDYSISLGFEDIKVTDLDKLSFYSANLRYFIKN